MYSFDLNYRALDRCLQVAQYDHEKAKVRLKIIERQMALHRALLYAQGRQGYDS